MQTLLVGGPACLPGPTIACSYMYISRVELHSVTSSARNSAAPLLASGLVLFFLCLWHFRAAGSISLQASAGYALLTLLFAGYGHIFLALVRDGFTGVAGFPLQLLSGFFIFNTLLFILTLLSPLGMPVNLTIMAVSCLLGLWGVRRRTALRTPLHDSIPGLIAILASGVASTMWVSDSQTPMAVRNGLVIFQTWQDTFIHVREISEFAQAHGVATIQDIRLSGVPAPIYHFASYVSAAAVTVLAPLSALNAYSSFQLPFGIFLTGLGAFSLISTLFGRWPALAATIAIVFFPDAYQQGFGNRYLSYSFLAHVNLGMLYGIACAAMSWMFMIEGCRRAKYGYLFLSYLFLIICLFYKAHVFVANAFLILIYPCLFFTSVKPLLRAVLAGFFVILFVTVITLAQSTGKMPLLRLDFSGLSYYIANLLNDFDAGIFKEFFTRIFVLEKHSRAVQGLYAIAMISLSTFGLWLAALAVTVVTARKRVDAIVICFPVLVLVNYIVMATGLAYDTRGIGSPDEMMNRPLVWAYYVIAIWTAGAAYSFIFGDKFPSTARGKIGVAIAGIASLLAPLPFYQGLQTFPARGIGDYAGFNAAPLCFVRASEFVRVNSSAGDVIQDSKNDPKFIFTALAERQSYVGAGPFGPAFKPVQDRVQSIRKFMEMNDPAEVRNFAADKKINWFLLSPESKIAWHGSLQANLKFECGDYKLFYFPRD